VVKKKKIKTPLGGGVTNVFVEIWSKKNGKKDEQKEGGRRGFLWNGKKHNRSTGVVF